MNMSIPLAERREIIRKGYRTGVPIAAIAAQLGSTEGSVRYAASRLGIKRKVRLSPPKPKDSRLDQAKRLVSIVTDTPRISAALIMADTGWPSQKLAALVVVAREVFGVPMAVTRFGSRNGFETYYEIWPDWPEGERLS